MKRPLLVVALGGHFFIGLEDYAGSRSEGVTLSQGGGLVNAVEELIDPFLADMGIELVDVEWGREHGLRYLRVLVDKEGGIDVDALTDVTEVVSKALDTAGVIDDRYNLEVSSPGLERPLKRVDDFIRFAGSKAAIRTKRPVEGRKNFVGTIGRADEEMMTLVTEDALIDLRYEDMAKANLVFEFGPAPKPGKKGPAPKKKGPATGKKRK